MEIYLQKISDPLKCNMGVPSAYRCTKLDCYAEGRIIVLALDTGVACITGYGAHTAPSTAPPLPPKTSPHFLMEHCYLSSVAACRALLLQSRRVGEPRAESGKGRCCCSSNSSKPKNPSEELKRTLGCPCRHRKPLQMLYYLLPFGFNLIGLKLGMWRNLIFLHTWSNFKSCLPASKNLTLSKQNLLKKYLLQVQFAIEEHRKSGPCKLGLYQGVPQICPKCNINM